MQPVERAEFEGIDYGWVMQTTFVLTILVGAPVVAVLSAFVTLESWGARAAFAVRVGAPIWFLTAVAVALYARRTDAGDGGVEDAENGDREQKDGTEPADREQKDGDVPDADTTRPNGDRDAAADADRDVADDHEKRSE